MTQLAELNIAGLAECKQPSPTRWHLGAPYFDSDEATQWAEELSRSVSGGAKPLLFLWNSGAARLVYEQLSLLRELATGVHGTSQTRAALARALQSVHSSLIDGLPCVQGLGWRPSSEHPRPEAVLQELRELVRQSADDARESLSRALFELLRAATLAGRKTEVVQLNDEIHSIAAEDDVWTDGFVELYTRSTFAALEATAPDSDVSTDLLNRLRRVVSERGIDVQYQAILGLALVRAHQRQADTALAELEEVFTTVVSYTGFFDSLPSRASRFERGASQASPSPTATVCAKLAGQDATHSCTRFCRGDALSALSK